MEPEEERPRHSADEERRRRWIETAVQILLKAAANIVLDHWRP